MHNKTGGVFRLCKTSKCRGLRGAQPTPPPPSFPSFAEDKDSGDSRLPNLVSIHGPSFRAFSRKYEVEAAAEGKQEREL